MWVADKLGDLVYTKVISECFRDKGFVIKRHINLSHYLFILLYYYYYYYYYYTVVNAHLSHSISEESQVRAPVELIDVAA